MLPLRGRRESEADLKSLTLLSEPTALALSRQRRTYGPSRDLCVTPGGELGHPAHSALETLRLSSGRAERPALADGFRLGGRNDGGAGIESRREWGLGSETA